MSWPPLLLLSSSLSSPLFLAYAAAIIFVIVWSGAGRIAGGVKDAGMSAKDYATWPGTASLGWLPSLKDLVLVLGCGLHKELGREETDNVAGNTV